MKILAIDLGTTMGWAYRESSPVFYSGVWDLSSKVHLAKGNRYVTLWRHLESFRRIRGMPTDVVYERPGNLFGHARKVLPAIQGIIELWTLMNEARLHDYLGSEVKKHACKGNAKKIDMLEAAKIKWPKRIFETHDECDAAFLLDLFAVKHGLDA